MDYSPVGELEMQLVERMAFCRWCLRRAQDLEVGLFEYGAIDSKMLKELMPGPLTARGALALAFVRQGNGADAFSKLSRYEVMRERSFYSAIHELLRHQAARAGREIAPPVAIDVNVTPPTIPVGR